MAALVALASLGLFLSAQSAAAHGEIVTIDSGGVSYPGYNTNEMPYLSPPGTSVQRKIDGNGPITGPLTGNNSIVSPVVFSTSENAVYGGDPAEMNALRFESVSPTLYADATAGDTVRITWTPWPASHRGPIMNYMASCGTTCDGVDADSLDWFAIQLDGWNAATRQWPQDVLQVTSYSDVTIPADLAPGKYILSHIPLAFVNMGAPQYFSRAFQINLTGSGTTVPACTAKFPDMYIGNNMADTFDGYQGDPTTFVIPGVPVYSGSSPCAASGSASAASSAAPASSAAASSVMASASASASASADVTSASSSASVLAVVASASSSAAASVATSVSAPALALSSSAAGAVSSAIASSAIGPVVATMRTSIVSARPTSLGGSAACTQKTVTVTVTGA